MQGRKRQKLNAHAKNISATSETLRLSTGKLFAFQLETHTFERMLMSHACLSTASCTKLFKVKSLIVNISWLCSCSVTYCRLSGMGSISLYQNHLLHSKLPVWKLLPQSYVKEVREAIHLSSQKLQA